MSAASDRTSAAFAPYRPKQSDLLFCCRLSPRVVFAIFVLLITALLAVMALPSLNVLIKSIPSSSTSSSSSSLRPKSSPRDDVNSFVEAAKHTATDKVSAHSYHRMYGRYLIPLIRDLHSTRPQTPVKLLEIGLGCDSSYGPGESVSLWKRLLAPTDAIWEAEENTTCADTFRNHPNLKNVSVLTGNQADTHVLLQWIALANAKDVPFDVIIDDGSHENPDLFKTFSVLWEVLRPGGIYFLEDLHVNRLEDWNPPPPTNSSSATTLPPTKPTPGSPLSPPQPQSQPLSEAAPVMLDVLHDWAEQLITARHKDKKRYRYTHSLPAGLLSVSCFAHGCALSKCPHRGEKNCV